LFGPVDFLLVARNSSVPEKLHQKKV
jgi:hypothetical protein